MVSKFYLRAWGDEKDCVDVIDLEQGRGFKTAIGSATVVSYVYDPDFLTHDLEGQFGKIESAAAPALKQLREEVPLTEQGQRVIIAFLDMHLERGRYADQAKITTPALVIKTKGETEEVDLKLGDRLLLSRYVEGAVRLSNLGLERWPWTLYKLYEGESLLTGDGAVLLWSETRDGELDTVTFPLGPELMLVIGRGIDPKIPINIFVAEKSRRWLVGSADTLTSDPARIAAARNPTQMQS